MWLGCMFKTFLHKRTHEIWSLSSANCADVSICRAVAIPFYYSSLGFTDYNFCLNPILPQLYLIKCANIKLVT
jgi:hypothetical protein